jgi:hypothetical protein
MAALSESTTISPSGWEHAETMLEKFLFRLKQQGGTAALIALLPSNA